MCDYVGGGSAPEEEMDRYGNQFATRVEVNTADGVIFADVVQESAGQGWFRLIVGGVVLSPMYATMEDAQDAADVILSRLVEKEIEMEVCISCVINYDNGSKAYIYTQKSENGSWYSYGFTVNMVAPGEDGYSKSEVVEQMHDYTERFTSQDAINVAIDGFTEDEGEGEGLEDQAPDFQYDDYPGEVLPTGWDSADHKALYE